VSAPLISKEILQCAVRAVRLACTVGRALQPDIASHAGTAAIAKVDTSPVTVADFSVQTVVTMVLERDLPSECPPFRLVAEEDADNLARPEMESVLDSVVDAVNGVLAPAAVSRGDVISTLRKGNYGGGVEEPFWVLDPIDGTKGFLRGGQYAVGLALVQRGIPIFGTSL
jgi:3'(2'), 5'-bisphosphate nucleotidase/inositol polyphosphate 1-phosphatase